ncbi:hypothetical protein A2U01_0097258, partial [Trifolium medium]|nr:hypothetical protein [Trifolium medium]
KRRNHIFSWETEDPDKEFERRAEGKEACEVVVVRGEVGLHLCDRIWRD